MADGTLIFNTDLDTSGLSTGLGKIGNVAGTAFKGVAVAAGAAATAVGFVTKGALDGYAAYEQLTGGVQTLFGLGGQSLEEYANSVGKTTEEALDAWLEYTTGERIVLNNAEQAYKTAGLSANEYMETVTSFSASLIQSLDGDTAKAAKVADMAITDMSDNANKMGTSIDMIQNAYNGFAKGNFTMLDNLKLGYGGTKEEMARLLEDATKISGIEYDMSSFADVAEAIHVVQTEIGITGTTAKEASSTIEGSTASMKAAWQNLLTGIADDEADLDSLIDQFVDSVVIAGENILPRVEIILNGIGQLVQTMLPVVIEMALTIITDTLPQLLLAGISMVESLLTGISENLGAIMEMALTVVMQLVNVLLENLPMLIETGMQVILQLAFGIAGALPELIPVIVDTVLLIVDTLINNIDMLVDAAIAIIVALAQGLINALPRLVEKAPEIVAKLVLAVINNATKLLDAGSKLISTLGQALISNLPKLLSRAQEVVNSLKDKFVSAVQSFTSVGRNIVDGIWNGISAGWNWLMDKVKGLASGLLNTAKKALGIASPSKEFKYIGEMCVAGFDDGVEDLIDGDAITRSINASVNTIGANTSTSNPRVGGFNQIINVNKEVGTPDELARVVRLESRYGLMKGVAFASG